jgi:preprotein translocase subunit SecY
LSKAQTEEAVDISTGTDDLNILRKVLPSKYILIMSLMNAWGVSIFLENNNIPITVSWDSFRLIYVLTVASGTMLLVWVADQITEKGIMNGVALIILVGILSDWIPALSRQYAESAKTDDLFITAFISLVLLLLHHLYFWFPQL